MRILIKNIIVLVFFALFLSSAILAQTSRRALFIGNSYTYTNDLPALTEDIAENMGDTLIYDQSTPGGYTFEAHLGNATSVSKIEEGNWDFVILQEQSQLPSFPIEQVETDCFPFAAELNDLVEENSPCAETMFFMTWGRKNGDSQNCADWPPVCTYEGMDDLLRERYLEMAAQNEAVVSPVGAVWRHIRENNASIDLYSPDESHPSQAGTYAAAVCFYTCLFRNDPEGITFNSTLSEEDAAYIRTSVKEVVFDHFDEWYIGSHDPQASLEWEEISGFLYQFTNTSTQAESFQISFGNEGWMEFNAASFLHTFDGPGTYQIGVIAESCALSDTIYYFIEVGVGSVKETDKDFFLYPNPAADRIFIQTPLSDTDLKSIALYSADGRLVRSIPMRGLRQMQVDIGDLATGNYQVCVLGLQSVSRQKLIVVR